MGRCRRRGCKYRASPNERRSLDQNCAYIAITGRSRVKACCDAAGIGYGDAERIAAMDPAVCPLYEAGQRTRRRTEIQISPREPDLSTYGRSMPRACLDETEARRLYEAGKTDREVAEAVGAKAYQVQLWRKRLGLAANQYTVYDWAAFRELYRAGKTDREIAAAIGCSDKAAQRHRLQLRLPANRAERRA